MKGLLWTLKSDSPKAVSPHSHSESHLSWKLHSHHVCCVLVSDEEQHYKNPAGGRRVSQCLSSFQNGPVCTHGTVLVCAALVHKWGQTLPQSRQGKGRQELRREKETGKKTALSGIKCEMDRAGLDGRRAGEGGIWLLKLSLQHT